MSLVVPNTRRHGASGSDERGSGQPANIVTGARIVLAAAVGVVALADGPRWLLGVLVTVALLSDLVDGRLARATGHHVRRSAPGSTRRPTRC